MVKTLRLASIVYGRVTSAPPGTGAAVVQTGGQHMNKKLQKKFTHPKKIAISDPSHAVRAGDTVSIARWPSLSRSKRIVYTVTEIIAPWGRDGVAPLSSRPAVWTEEQRRAWRHERLLAQGTPPTQKGLRDGSLYIGEEGKIMRRVREKEPWKVDPKSKDTRPKVDVVQEQPNDGLREMKESEAA